MEICARFRLSLENNVFQKSCTSAFCLILMGKKNHPILVGRFNHAF